MNAAYDDILRAETQTRSGLFAATAQRLCTTPQNVEKDFWICWTLDTLFNGLGDGPRLLFKGGTSLAKAFGLIQRFSDDIDVTAFRDDLRIPASVDERAELSGANAMLLWMRSRRPAKPISTARLQNVWRRSAARLSRDERDDLWRSTRV